MKYFAIAILLLSLFAFNSFAGNRFSPLDINAAHRHMESRVNNTDKILNSDYIKSYVLSRVKRKLKDKDWMDSDDLIVINDEEQKDNSINSVEVEAGGEIKGDVYIIDTGDGDNTIIDEK